MLTLSFHPDGARDLASLQGFRPKVADRILATLEEIKADKSLLDALTTHGFGEAKDEKFRISKWLSQWRRGRDLWSLKIWELEDMGIRYRVIYCYMPDELAYYILAITPRDAAYGDDTDELTTRILQAYASLK